MKPTAMTMTATNKNGGAYSALALRYDVLMDDYDYAKWCGFYCEIAGLRRGMSVVEAGCGTGLMTEQLLKRGMKVIASDISEEMLQAAGERLRAAGAFGNVNLVRMDMRNLAVHKPCDAVICACDGVNYLTGGLDGFIESAYNALKPGGVLAFDISSAGKLRGMDGQLFYDDRDDETCFWSARFDDETCLLNIDLTMFMQTKSGDGLYERLDEQQVMRAYGSGEIVQALHKKGLCEINIYGDYSGAGAPAAPGEEDKRLHFAAVKVE